MAKRLSYSLFMNYFSYFHPSPVTRTKKHDPVSVTAVSPRPHFTGLETIGDKPFVLDSKTGLVTLNFDPQKGMKGYFDFVVCNPCDHFGAKM